MSADLVSVIIPTRDRPAMLREAIESVLAQTYRPVEIIVVLTGATQEADEVAVSFGTSIRVMRTARFNAAEARNIGIAFARGRWVSFLDDDDLWLPSKLQRQMEAARDQNADLVMTNWIFFGEGRPEELWMPVGQSPLPEGMTHQEAMVINNYVSISSLVRTEAFRELNGFDPTLRLCEDWDMWRRISHKNKITYIDEPLVRIRSHGSNTRSRRWLMARYTMRHLIKMHFDTPPHLRHVLRRARRETFRRAFPWLFPMYWVYEINRIRRIWTSWIRSIIVSLWRSASRNP